MAGALGQRHFICLVIRVFDVQLNRLILILFLVLGKVLSSLVVLQLLIALPGLL